MADVTQDRKLRGHEKSEMRDRVRIPLPLSHFEAPRQTINEQLKAIDECALLVEECIGLRLYTGPLFIKYNAVLRGISGRVAFLQSTMEELCRGNKYTCAAGSRTPDLCAGAKCPHVALLATARAADYEKGPTLDRSPRTAGRPCTWSTRQSSS